MNLFIYLLHNYIGRECSVCVPRARDLNSNPVHCKNLAGFN